MLSLLLFAIHPDLAPLREPGYSIETTCPFEMSLMFDADEEDIRRTLRIDPRTDETLILDENGEPIDPERTRERQAEMNGGDDDDDDSVGINTTSYADVLDKLALPYTLESREAGLATYRSEKLPKGSVLLDELDLSKNASIILKVREDQGTPFVETYLEELDKPLRIKVVARMKTYAKEVNFQVRDGVVLNKGGRLEASFSAMGNEQSMRVETAFEHLPCEGA